MEAFTIKTRTPNSTVEETLLLLKQAAMLAITSGLVKFVSPLVIRVWLPLFFFYSYYYFFRIRALMNRKFIKNNGVILHHFFNLTSTHYKRWKLPLWTLFYRPRWNFSFFFNNQSCIKKISNKLSYKENKE